ncbi:MAG: sigma-54-dependent transcriptional regulator [Candidatus Zhuqueibacterota bacterium]
MSRILIVDDERDMRWILANILRTEYYEISEAESGEQALNVIRKERPELVLLDKMIPGKMDGIEVLRQVKSIDSSICVIMITAIGDSKSIVNAVKMGAFDYILKPFDDEELLITVSRALEQRSLSLEVIELRARLEHRETLESVMGSSETIRSIHKQIEKVAGTDFTVLLQGESGTGKEVVARAIHQLSQRRNKPFVAVDCGAIPDTLVESELFGYEKGAFTGADARKEGQFELANTGTIFLDEIGNIPYPVQKKMLRLIQERKVQHLGGKKLIDVDVRIIAATNENLSAQIDKGDFRSDLYYRLNEFKITLPNLRERKDDIPFLADKFLKETSAELKKGVKGFSNDALKKLMSYQWKGNIRELKNVIRRAVLLCDDRVGIEHLIFDHQQVPAYLCFQDYIDPKNIRPLKEVNRQILSMVEKEAISNALLFTKGNKNRASRILDIDYKTLLTKIKAYGIDYRELARKQ